MSRRAPTVICLTPVRNEAWILDRFLACASVWADHIVVADNGSDDGSREIAQRHPKVTLIDNRNPSYDEGARQRLLIETARRIPGPRVLVALDADESLTPNVQQSRAWSDAVSASPGTVIRLPWINLLPGGETAWVPVEPVVFGLVDDDRSHSGERVHSQRLPVGPGAPVLDLDEVGVVHYQYLAEERARAKQRWYQCFERIEFPRKRPAEIYRQYHRMDAWPSAEIRPVASALAGFDDAGTIDVETGNQGRDAWHRLILDLMREHGAMAFRRIDIWDVDWTTEAERLGTDVPQDLLADPRRRLDRAALRWLQFAQPKRGSAAIRAISRSLQVVGW